MSKGLAITAQDFSFDRHPAGWNIPVTDRLAGLWRFGGDVQLSALNLADGFDADIIGDPEVFDHYVRFDAGEHYFRTQMRDPITGTFVVVARGADTYADNAHRPAFIAVSSSSSGAGGAALYVPGTNTVQIQTFEELDDIITGNLLSTGDTINPDDWFCWIADFSDVDQSIYNMTNAQDGTETRPPGAVRSQALLPLSIGSFTDSATVGGLGDIAMAAIYTKQLSLAERTAMHEFLQDYYGRRDIII